MHVVITDFVTAECEFSGRSAIECVLVSLDEATPQAVISTGELVKWLRFQKKQEEKRRKKSAAGNRERASTKRPEDGGDG